jgi:hypothetical protein
MLWSNILWRFSVFILMASENHQKHVSMARSENRLKIFWKPTSRAALEVTRLATTRWICHLSQPPFPAVYAIQVCGNNVSTCTSTRSSNLCHILQIDFDKCWYGTSLKHTDTWWILTVSSEVRVHYPNTMQVLYLVPLNVPQTGNCLSRKLKISNRYPVHFFVRRVIWEE